MASRIQMRRDTSANWTTANPTLAQGEIGIETDTNKLKLGTGTDNWVTLPYYSTGLINGSGATDKFARWTDSNTLEGLTAAETRTALNIEDGAEANNISDVDATDLTDGNDSSLHYHSSDRDRANHTGTQLSNTISDFDIEVSNNTEVTLNTTHRGLSDNPHSVTKTQIGLSNVPNLDTSDASNITTGTLPSSVLPPIAITDTFTAVDETAQLALIVQKGDICVRTDENKSYINKEGNNTSMSDWQELMTPTDSVLTVNGKTGTVVLNQDEIGDGSTYVRTQNDFSDTLKTKLDGIEDGAEVNVQSDWDATSGDAMILNKPSIGDVSLLAEIEDKIKNNIITEFFVWNATSGDIERKDYKDNSSTIVYKKDYVWGVDGISSWTITRVSDNKTLTCTFSYSSGELSTKTYS